MRRILPALVTALALAGCVGAPPGIEGSPGAPPRPNSYWAPPSSVRAATPARPAAAAFALSDSMLRRLTLADAVDIALENNPATRVSWAQARAQSDEEGVERVGVEDDGEGDEEERADGRVHWAPRRRRMVLMVSNMMRRSRPSDMCLT